MTIPWFYALPSWIDTTGGTVTLKGAEAKHLALSLRARAGQEVMIGDGAGTVYEVELTSVRPELVEGRIRSATRPPHERPRLVLFQALARAVKMDEVVTRAAETGVWAVVPFISPRSPVGSAEKAGERLERWRKIAFEASKVSRRAWSLVVGEPRNWPLVAGDPLSRRVIEGLLGEQDLNLLLWEEEETESVEAALPANPPKSIGVIVGPEGGFAADEAGVLAAAGATTASMGPLILRTESAGSYAAMLVRNRYGLLLPGGAPPVGK
jgi:16S rRNA (uracil1498-N3)-methyltransferase